MTVMTKTKSTTSTSDLHKDVNAILKLIENFGTLLMRETDALRSADFKTVDMLQEDKKAYAREYHGLVTSLAARRDEMIKLDMPLRERLIRARTNLTLILNDNLKALESAKDSTKRLVDRILDIARTAVVDDQQTSYSAKGNMQSYKSSTVSLTVDSRL